MFVRRKSLIPPALKTLPMHRKLSPAYEHGGSALVMVQSFLADYLGGTGDLWKQAMREVARRGGPSYFTRSSGEPNTAMLEKLVHELTGGRQGYAQKKLVRKQDSAGRDYCYDDAQGAYHRISCSQAGGGGAAAEQGGGEQSGKEGADKNDVEVNAGGYEYEEPLPDGKGKREHAPPPPGEKIVPANGPLYSPDPQAEDPKTGLPCCARVGLPAMMVPPPPKKIPRLPNLTDKEREVEDRFASAYENDPDGVVEQYREALRERKIGDAPHIFNTDDAKLLSPDYNPQGVSEQENKNAKGFYNSAVFQTANAIAKRAFLKHLDDVVAKLPDGDAKKTVLVTSGGCAAGKGFALKNIPETAGMLDSVGAVWDAAGELNGVENDWIFQEARKRGIKMIFAFIHADPVNTWENPERGVVERAGKVGRMVDARTFADSYSVGARNFNKFMNQHIEDPDVAIHVIDNATGGKPKKLDALPEQALNHDSENIYARAVEVIDERKDRLSEGVVRGATAGERIWGKPAPSEKTEGKSLHTARNKRYGSKAMSNSKKDPALQKLSDSLLSGMLRNLEANNSNADKIDEEAFQRSLQVKPIDVPESEVKQEEQAPTEEPEPVEQPVPKKKLKDLRSKYGKGEKAMGGHPYGYDIHHGFYCELCAEGFGKEDRTQPVWKEPWIGYQCGGCDQYYLGNHRWGTKRELEQLRKE